MRARFHPWPMPDGTPRPPMPAELLQSWPDGTETLRVSSPDGKPSVVIARRGGGEPGTWEPVEAPAIPETRDVTPNVAPPPPSDQGRVVAGYASVRRLPARPAAAGQLDRVGVRRGPRPRMPADDDRPELSTCLYCLRRGRWPGHYCSDDHAARAAPPPGVDPWSTRSRSYREP